MHKLLNGKVRRSESEWKEIFKRYKVSGKTRREFSAAEGIALSSFDKWQKKFEKPAPKEGSKFIEVSSPGKSQEACEIELELASGTVVRIRG